VFVLVGHMRAKGRTPHGGLAEIAGRQHGVVDRSQLEGLGIGESTVTRWVREGRLHRLHRGVYAVGHPAISWEGRCLAAVLARPGAVAGHRTAAWIPRPAPLTARDDPPHGADAAAQPAGVRRPLRAARAGGSRHRRRDPGHRARPDGARPRGRGDARGGRTAPAARRRARAAGPPPIRRAARPHQRGTVAGAG
jgi:hypothetical protein